MASLGNHTFIDGVGDIRLRDGVVRMDLLALSPTRRDKEGNPVPQFVDQLVMSPVAFGRLVQALGQTVQQMQKQGLIHKGGDGGDAPAKAPAKKKGGKGKAASPNF